MRSVVFLDLGGTVALDRVAMRLLEGSAEGLRLFHAAGYDLVVVSTRPPLPTATPGSVAWRLRDLFGDAGVPLGGFYGCRDGECRTSPLALLRRAVREHHAALARSWLIGDVLDDIEAGQQAGCRTVLIDPGGETDWGRWSWGAPDHVATDLAEAARLVLGVVRGPAACRSGRGWWPADPPATQYQVASAVPERGWVGQAPSMTTGEMGAAMILDAGPLTARADMARPGAGRPQAEGVQPGSRSRG